MSKSLSFDVCAKYKQVWESIHGQRYYITGRDLAEAKQFLLLNGIVDAADVERQAKSYFKSDFHGWESQGWPAWGLFRNWMSFTPKVEKPAVRRTTRTCPDCQTIHSIQSPCPPVLSLVEKARKEA